MAARARGGLVALLAAAFVAAASSSSAGAGGSLPAPAFVPGLIHTTMLDAAGLRRLASREWLSRKGSAFRLSISPAYASDPGAQQRWTNFFTSLLHGPELDLLDAYVAPSEVEEICGGEAFGCYGSNHLVTMGEANLGITAETVARHEYGHHIAANRMNPPWLAVDWGTKRWASSVGVCSRVGAGTAFPGDEGLNYELNPGEAFAESYRVLIETNGTAVGYDWPILDDSFRRRPRRLRPCGGRTAPVGTAAGAHDPGQVPSRSAHGPRWSPRRSTGISSSASLLPEAEQTA